MLRMFNSIFTCLNKLSRSLNFAMAWAKFFLSTWSDGVYFMNDSNSST